MTEPDGERPPRGPWIPEHLRGLKPDEATDEQRAEIRAAIRRQLAELDAYWTPERRAGSAARVERRLAEIRAQVDVRNAAEAADPSLRWRRLGEAAARDAVFAERVIPAEGVAVFREAFDEALPQVRASNPLGR